MVWANPVSLAATQGIAFAFSSSGYLDVSVPRVCLLISYEFRYGYHSITSGGFPHSEISGSKLAYSSPKHIGVRPVLHRLLVPRHPPCALSNLTVKKNHYVISCITIECDVYCYLVFKEHVSKESSFKTKQDRERSVYKTQGLIFRIISLERR